MRSRTPSIEILRLKKLAASPAGLVGGGSLFVNSDGDLAYVDDEGVVTVLGSGAEPFSGCKVHRVADFTVPTGVTTYVPWDGESYDTDAYHSLVTNPTRVTVPTTGYYRIGCQYHWNDGAGGGYRGVLVRLNGTTFVLEEYRVPAAPADTTGAPSTERRLTAGDYLEMGLLQTTGGDRSVYGLPPRDATAFAVSLIGT